jgi:hypothetical protein
MKKISFIAFILCSFLLAANRSQAQDYKTAVGLKFGGYENGFSVKHFMDDQGTALEGILGIRSHGAVLTGLYELHQPAFNTAGLKFYYGFGAHLGSVSARAGTGPSAATTSTIRRQPHPCWVPTVCLAWNTKLPMPPSPSAWTLNPRVELATGPFFDLAPGLGLKYTF